ncbi:cytochrome P450 [Amycolatopsis sp.]|uniref:cytochrome P450 n=1 Tax=Amycolatopsis sp. TaxID=37632 RepID=UPI002D1BC183|nr:cytochrome P450 [Amycolatopsis sp.]HVV11884.1 cytochrome P450 [Amycolatopsis sp.]
MTAATPQIDIMGEEAIRDPYGAFAPLRSERPVYWDPKYRSWLITRHEYVSAALRDDRFSSDRIAPFIERKLSAPDTDPLLRQAFEVLRHWMVFQDEPSHMRLRNLVRRAFTPRAVAKMQERVAALSAELLAGIPMGEEFDLVAEFAFPLPAIIIAEMLGVPPEDRDTFKHWTEDVAPLVSAGLDDPERYNRATSAMDALVAYFTGLIRRFEGEPADNLISALLAARDDGGSLSEAEVVATCTLLLFGGHETTANLIANSMLALLRHPEQLAALRDGRIAPRQAVEEFLRYDGPGKAVVRIMREDTEFAGETLRKGQRVFLLLAAANHDPDVFDDPDVLRLDRAENPHVAFGFGPHFCLGSALARLEASIAVPALVAGLPGVRLADRQLRWQQVLLTRGLQELWLHNEGSSE